MKALFARIRSLIRVVVTLASTPPAALPPHCSNINALAMHLCDFDADLYNWLVRWLAYPLRNPGAKMQTGLIINNEHATGKTMFFEDVIAAIYAHAGKAIVPHQLLEGQNQWLTTARFVVIDTGGYHRGLTQRLKRLITQPEIVVRGPDQYPYLMPNKINLVVLVNGTGFLPVTTADRHCIVIESPPAQPRHFYRAVAAEINNGGIEAFRRYLVEELDMGDFNPGTQPPPQFQPRHAA